MYEEGMEYWCFNHECQNRMSIGKDENRCLVFGCPYRFEGVRLKYDIKTKITQKDENNS